MFSDRFLVGALLTVKDFAVFRNGTMDIPLLSTLYSTISSVVMPEISRHYSRGEYDDIVLLKRKVITVTAAIVYPMVVFLLVFSLPLVVLFFTDKYADSAAVFSIMMVGLLFRGNDYMDILLAASKGRLLSTVYLVAFAVNGLAGYVFIRLFGCWGAALGIVLTQAGFMGCLFWFSARTLRRPVFEFVEIKSIATIALISTVLPVAFRIAGFGIHRFWFLAAYGGISSLFSYFLILKAGIIEYSDVSPVIRKIPVGGLKLDRYFGGVFENWSPSLSLSRTQGGGSP